MNSRMCGDNSLQLLVRLTASAPLLPLLLLSASGAIILARGWLERYAALPAAQQATLGLLLAAHLTALGFFLCALLRFWRRYDRLVIAIAAGFCASALFFVAAYLTCQRPEPGWIGWLIGAKVYWYLLPLYALGSATAGFGLYRLLARRTLPT